MKTSIRCVLALTLAAFLPACTVLHAVDVASGFTSHVMCSETFVSGLAPDRIYRERIKTNVTPVAWGLLFQVDNPHQAVRATVFGGFESRAVYRDGMGCLLERSGKPAEATGLRQTATEPAAPLLPPIAGSDVVEPQDAALRAALDRVFTEPPAPAQRFTRAVVVVHDGKIIAERYAPGIGIDTPLLSFSVAKSVTNALIGILVREGKLSVDQPAPLPAWRNPNDPRHAITINQLLRQTSGLALDQTNSGFDRNSRMTFVEPDMAGFAQTAELEAPPGTRWAYADGHYILLSRIIHDAVGGHAADVVRFARHELFGPLGMRHATIEFDATGTPLGASFMFATARDWARFGQLYLNDGVVGGKRILPKGWVRYSTSQTLDTGYGAGFFINTVDGWVPDWGTPWGMVHLPRDTFFARGFMEQAIVIIPSERLVVARFSSAHGEPDVLPTDRLIGDVIAALHREPIARALNH